ncbi:MAG: histidine ammonia-lyase [Candidatus Marinimicrobia bacterium]|jgi:histidine ammonia-lyase|nr:histidine ammonia-lyase [Candidatus Neomarinimicrobiota bacterium]MDP7217575.1 histidine ammonia-lyase [Candidatus Neomarinimicrobiota bacterium]MDP7436354.1 histidine ammonia-lyase [Candidatus Neomarinimicrobiota bacterium]|tara:strand:- start:19569 stop:21095 length:1527 start_codon:yes stop_codon:yes gene_type:complete
MGTLPISKSFLHTADLQSFLNAPGKVRLTPDAHQAIKKSHQNLKALLASGINIYGVNTGFGKLSQVSIPESDQKQLQLNLVRSHAAGVGKSFDAGITRLIMILKLMTFAQGYSGVRPALTKQLVNFINHDILPVIPRQGSVGASGDLAPLAHLAMGLIGEGSVHFQDRIMPALVAIKEAGLEPLVLEAKEGLAMVNGTHVSSALGIKAMLAAENILQTADISGAMSVEASLASRNVFEVKIHKLKKHKGQLQSAGNVWRLLDKSAIVDDHADCDRIQDPYSFRCIPHVHGSSRELYKSAKNIVENEANSVSDNPLIFSAKEIRNSGHFHAEAVAQALDTLSISISEIGAISERRIHFFMKGIDDKIPMFVAHNPGLESGFMMAQVTAASLASENKTLAHPAAVDSISTSVGQEDLVSMAPWAGRKCLRIIENVNQILAIELYVAATATTEFHKGLRPGVGTAKVLNLLKRHVRFSKGDHPLHEDMSTIADLVRSGKIVDSVNKSVKLE